MLIRDSQRLKTSQKATDRIIPTTSRDGYYVVSDDMRVGMVKRLTTRTRTNNGRVIGWLMYLRAGSGCDDYIPAGVCENRGAAVRIILRRSK